VNAPSLSKRKLPTLAGCLAMTALIISGSLVQSAQARGSTHIAPAIKAGGTANVFDFAAPDCLDPQQTVSGASELVYDQVADDLVTLNPRGKLEPDLAVNWAFSHGDKWITFDLRKGVKFSNGDPLTASAVKASFERDLNPATKSPSVSSDLGLLRSIKVVNKDTVRLIMKQAFRPIMSKLGFDGTSLAIIDAKAMNKEGLAKACDKPIGTGAFKIQSVGPDFSTVTLVRNPSHNWGLEWAHNKGPAYLSKLVFHSIPDTTTQASELLAGQLDVANIAGTQLPRVEGNKSIKLYKDFGTVMTWLEFNTSHKPFNSQAVRRAFSEAISRAAVAKVATNGLGVAATSPEPVRWSYYDKSTKKYLVPFNPTAAQKTLAAEHVTGPFDLLTYDIPEFTTAAQLIQGELANVGVKINVVAKPVADAISAASSGQFDLTFLNFGGIDPDQLYLFLDSSQAAPAGSNYTGYKSAKLDQLLTSGRETLSTKKAALIYSRAQKFIATHAVVDPLWMDVFIFGVRDRVGGFRPFYNPLVLYQDMYVQK